MGAVEVAQLGFGEAAVANVERWRFFPGLKDGIPVPVKATVVLRYRR